MCSIEAKTFRNVHQMSYEFKYIIFERKNPLFFVIDIEITKFKTKVRL